MPSQKDKIYGNMIEKTNEHAMGEDDIRDFFPKAKIIRYTNLKKYKSLKELLPKKNDYAFILYQNSEYEGHWTLIIRHGNYIEYYDSYGNKIDEPLNWISKEQNNKLGIHEPYLSNLIKGAGLPLYYNDKKFQDENNEINTCGRHAIMRLMSIMENKTDIGRYKDMMEHLKKKLKVSYDDIVSGFINHYTQKN